MKIFGSSLTQILQALGLSSSGGTGQVLKQKTAGGAPVAEALAASDLLAALASGKYAVLPFSNVAGTANAITADSGVTLAAGQFFSLVVGTTSTSTTVNLNPDGTSNKRIKGPDGSTDPAVGDLIAGRVVILYYDGTSFRLLLGAPVSATNSPSQDPLQTPVATGGSGSSYTLTDTRVGTPADGQVFGFLAHADCTAGCQLNVNSSGGRYLVNQAGIGVVAAQIKARSFVIAKYDSTSNYYYVLSALPLTPSDMPYSAAGTTFTNDGNWYDFYSLAQGTHNGRFFIASALFAGFAIFTINGTSISLVTDEWGFADVTAASGKIAFRVSGGYLQINVGTSISSTPRKFSAIFMGTVN